MVSSIEGHLMTEDDPVCLHSLTQPSLIPNLPFLGSVGCEFLPFLSQMYPTSTSKSLAWNRHYFFILLWTEVKQLSSQTGFPTSALVGSLQFVPHSLYHFLKGLATGLLS